MSNTLVVHRSPLARILALASALTLLVASAPTAPSGAPSAAGEISAAAGEVSDAVAHAADAVVGGQFFNNKAACLACAGVIIGLGGTSVLGVVVVLSGVPEFGLACGLVCYDAYA